jgi:hypothetical protein
MSFLAGLFVLHPEQYVWASRVRASGRPGRRVVWVCDEGSVKAAQENVR